MGPAQTAKKTRPRPNSKKINTPPTLPSVFFAVWAGSRVYVFAVWAGGFFCFAVWVVCVFLILLCGRGRVHILLFGRGS